MKLINQSYEICKTHGYTLQDIYKDIERAARVSYKSEDKITEDSAEKMVKRLINMKHYSPLEFGTVYLKFPNICLSEVDVEKYETNPFSAVTITTDSTRYVTTNYRVIVENRWEDDLKYMCEPTKHHQRRTTVKFITNRAMTHELVRHRSMSFMQEGQRYCNYAKDKFGNQLTFIIPVQCTKDIPNNTELKDNIDIDNFVWGDNNGMKFLKVNKLTQGMLYLFYDTEVHYIGLINLGWKPQEVRAILPNATKTEIYMCGFDRDWAHFFELRDKPHVDPQMYDLAHNLHSDFKDKNMKKKLDETERNRMLKLIEEAKKHGEDHVASLIQLAINLSDKGEYDKFIQIFSEND